MKPLSRLKPGQVGVVLKLENTPLSPRLVEMGLYPGKVVQVLFAAPLGDPIAVDLGGSVLSLRLREAEMVCVESRAEAT